MFKYIKFALIIAFGLYSPVQAQKQVERFFNNTEGLVDRYSQLAVSQNSASAINNIMFDDRGQLSKRDGYTKNNAAALAGAAVTGIGYQTSGSNSYYTVVSGSQIYRTGYSLGGTYTNITGTVTLTNANTNIIQFTTFNGQSIGCSESDPPFKVGISGNAFKLVNVSTIAKTCAGFGNYLVLGNTQEGTTALPSRIRWSDINNPDSWPANNYIDVEPDDGDGITTVIAYQASLYIFKKRSIHQLIITGLDGADAFIIRPVARGIGAYAKNSVKVIDNVGIVFLGQNGIYLYDGSILELISDQIQRQVDTFTRTRYQYCVGEVYRTRNQYWLAYTPSTTNTQLVVYDYILKAWTVYSGMEVNAIGAGEDSTGKAVILTGSNAGNVHRQDVAGENDNPDGVETAISASYTTQDLHFGTPELDKSFRYLYALSVLNSSTTITIQTAYNLATDFVDSYSFSLAEAAGGAIWDNAIWDTATWPTIESQIFRRTLDRTGRTIRIKFSNAGMDQIMDVLGWAVIYEFTDWKEQ
jgi:hypothetical protein